jgi:hypothetical protein
MKNTEVSTTKARIRPNVANMVKSSGGSFHKDDFIGNALAGLNLEQVKTIAADLGLDPSKYSHLNNGQQRMALGNSLRKMAGALEPSGWPADGGLKDEFVMARDRIEAAASSFREQNAADKAANDQLKANAKAEKAAAKAAKTSKKKVAEPAA